MVHDIAASEKKNRGPSLHGRVTSRYRSPERKHPFPRAQQVAPLIVSDSTARHYATKDPDVRLMLEVRNDNAEAFEELMIRYQGRVLSVLQHVVGNREWAEDLTQEAFLRVYRARKKYVASAKFATWLFTIANNVALNALRSRRRKPEVQLEGRESGPWGAHPLEQLLQASSGQVPARRIDQMETREIVRLAVELLSERQKMAVLLNKFEGMSYQEIADTMELTPQAVKSLLCRARTNLKEILEPYLRSGKSLQPDQSTTADPLSDA